MLESLGLGSEAGDVYQAILANPQDGVAQLAKRLGWQQERVRAALDELAELSLVRPSWQAPGKVRAVNPEVGLASLLARKERELLQRQQEISATRLQVAHLIDDYSDLCRTRRYPDFERLSGIDEIRSRIEVLAENCRADMMAFAPRGAQSAEAMSASQPLDQTVVGRGVLMRTVYVHGIYNDRSSIDYARWLVTIGARVRTTAALALRMIVYDRRLALLPVDPAAESAGALLLHGTGVVSALCELFEQTWQEALPLGAERERRGGDDLTSQELATLRLLAGGHTDAVIARRLGVSVRTARRITADVMTRLGARSRFQAGVRAAELGWLEPRLSGT